MYVLIVKGTAPPEKTAGVVALIAMKNANGMLSQNAGAMKNGQG